ncbi:hypothetical protein KCU82_g23919, partial [Aureobasidium melanogenum]
MPMPITIITITTACQKSKCLTRPLLSILSATLLTPVRHNKLELLLHLLIITTITIITPFMPMHLIITITTLPPRESTPLDFKYHFKSSVKPIPRFEDKANCTFTVRVPRAYLGASSAVEEDSGTIAGGLEEICKTRAVWGSDVYSDDSDPIAAAVHSGWIRG